jgi:hypothetical protein
LVIAAEPGGADADSDGVADDADRCPNSVRGSDGHVDANGCTRLQVDSDLDGWCNPDRPRDAQNRWLSTVHDWCVGVDNCKFVANADQAGVVQIVWVRGTALAPSHGYP